MAMISIDPKAMVASSKSIKEKGTDLGNKLQQVSAKIKEMGNVWTGEQYNNVVKIYQTIRPNMIEIVKITREELPAALISVANNYLAADGRGAEATPNIDAVNFEELAVKETNVIAIDVSSVTEQGTQLNELFSSAKAQMSEIESLVNNLEWQGEAAQSFRTKIQKERAKIEEDFDFISSHFKTWINESVEAMKKAEANATVK